jgi:hypothetical protein
MAQEVKTESQSTKKWRTDPADIKYHLADEAKCNEIHTWLVGASDRLDSMLESEPGGETSKSYAFQLIDVGKKAAKVILPANIMEFNDTATTGILKIMMELQIPFEVKECEPFKVTEDDSCRRFFKAFFNTLTREPNEGEKITFKSKNDSARGASAAKYCLLKESTIDKQALTFLPEQATESEKRLNILSTYLSKLSGREGPESLKRYISTYKFLIDQYCQSVALAKWKAPIDNYTIPVGTALAGLHKTKKVQTTVNRKKITKTVTVNPNRPSQRIEVLSEAEKEIISYDERSFKSYKDLLTLPDGESVIINLNNVISIRKKAKSLITEMWNVVQKWSPLLTKRMKLYNSYIKSAQLPEYMNAEGMKAFTEFIQRLNDGYKIAKQLSPIAVIRASQLSANEKSICENYFHSFANVYLQDMSPVTLNAFKSWHETFKNVREADAINDTERFTNAFDSFNNMKVNDDEKDESMGT